MKSTSDRLARPRAEAHMVDIVRVDLDHALRIAARLEDEETIRELEQHK